MVSKKHFAAATTAFITWGFFSLALRPLAHFNSFLILFYRVIGAAIIISLFNFLFNRKKITETITTLKSINQKKFWLFNTVSAILLFSNWFLFIYAINHISIMSASLAYLICPIVTNMLGVVILKEKLAKNQWLAVLISFIAISTITVTGGGSVIISLIIAFTYAMYLIVQKFIKGFDSIIILNIQLLLIALLSLPTMLFIDITPPSDPFFYKIILLIILLFTIFPLLLNIYSLKGLDSGTIGILIYINPIFNFNLAYFYFGESKPLIEFICYGLVILSIIIYNWELFKKRNA